MSANAKAANSETTRSLQSSLLNIFPLIQQIHMRQKLVLNGLMMALTISFMSCSKNEPTFSNIPVIGYRSIVKHTSATNVAVTRRDSVVISITFKDGDGNLGEDVRDTTRLNQMFANQAWGNYQIRTFKFVSGRFEEVLTAANSKLFFQQAGTKQGPTEGMLDFTQKFPYQSNTKLTPVKFQIRLRDRDLNESNIIETDTVSIHIM